MDDTENKAISRKRAQCGIKINSKDLRIKLPGLQSSFAIIC